MGPRGKGGQRNFGLGKKGKDGTWTRIETSNWIEELELASYYSWKPEKVPGKMKERKIGLS